MKLFTCIDHDSVYPVGVASIVIAENEIEARALLDAALKDRNLASSNEQPYSLVEVELNAPQAIVLRDGDY